jgi:hypothetical protein
MIVVFNIDPDGLRTPLPNVPTIRTVQIEQLTKVFQLISFVQNYMKIFTAIFHLE